MKLAPIAGFQVPALVNVHVHVPLFLDFFVCRVLILPGYGSRGMPPATLPHERHSSRLVLVPRQYWGYPTELVMASILDLGIYRTPSYLMTNSKSIMITISL